VQRILAKDRVRRIDVQQVQAILAATPLSVAPGAAEATSQHALLLLPRLRLLQQQRAIICKRIDTLLDQLAKTEQTDGETIGHRNAEVLLSLPGVWKTDCRHDAQRSLTGHTLYDPQRGPA
jgi:hypothetical protein